MEFRVCRACGKAVTGATACPGCGAGLSLAGPELFLGQVFGKYRLDRVLGQGGMGVVYLATHLTLERPAALKIVLPEHGDDSFATRFVREARVLAELKHPNVVEVYDFDVSSWDTPYYVMEYLRGHTLRDEIAARGPLPVAEVAATLGEVAAGLDFAHRRGVVHRDLKPENIFLAEYDGRRLAKVLDFGIAKRVSLDEAETRLTKSGAVVGTLHYLAPEQVLGQPLSAACDQYALALVAAEMVSGRAVRAGKTMGEIFTGAIRRPVTAADARLELAPATVREAVARATDPDPLRRFPDVPAFVAALSGVEAPPPRPDTALYDRARTSLAMTGPGSRPLAVRRRRPLLVAALATVLVAAAVAAVVLRGRPAVEPLAPDGWLAAARTLPVPMDVIEILSAGDPVLYLRTRTSVVGVPTVGEARATRLDLAPERVLGGSDDGGLIVVEGGQVVVVDPDDGTRLPWAGGLPDGPLVAASPSARVVAVAAGERLQVLVAEGLRFRPALELPMPAEPRRVAVGERLLATVGGGRLEVWEVATARRVLDLDLAAGGWSKVTDLAIADDAGLVALGGWFGQVVVVRVADGSRETVERPSADLSELDLLFLPEGPSLAIAGGEAVAIWRPGRGEVARWSERGAELSDLAFSAGRLWALDRSDHTVVDLAVGDLPVAAVQAIDEVEVWALAADPAGGRVFVAAADGGITAVDLARGTAQRHQVHSMGVTSLVCAGDRLASASDDATIAVWKLPELSVEWRSRAHGQLVNQLYLEESSGSLWSASSDGRVKRWSWPELVEQESVDLGELLSGPQALHAIWAAPDGDLVLVGTWQRRLLVLERGDGGWTARALPFAAYGGYRLVGLPAVAAVALVGILHPYELAAYDLSRQELVRLPDAGQAARAAVALDDGRRLLAFASGAMLDYRLARAADGSLAPTLAVRQQSALGVVSAAVALGPSSVAVADNHGRVLRLELDGR